VEQRQTSSFSLLIKLLGVNFIFYYSTPFLKSTGAIGNTFLISLIFTLVNVCSTPISFFTVEKFGRRPLLVYGALGMLICQFLVAIIGVTVGFNHTHNIGLDATGMPITRANNISAVNAQIAFIAIFIFFFASTWGPGAWIVIGEIFPLPIRSRGVALSTASNWLWNTVSLPPRKLDEQTESSTMYLLTPSRSLQSSPPTWSVPTTETSAVPSSSFGEVL